MRRSLADWLSWQQTLHPRDIDLGLPRVRAVLQRLDISPPPGRVFSIAGTNGKGTTAHYLAAMLSAFGWRTGVYTSPHLVRYNERVRLSGAAATDDELVDAFEAIDHARQHDPLTYFEFGTLAALWLFSRAHLDAWVLEVGLGGRLDAVNVIDPDFSLITTIALDHQDWLGHTLEEIAAEKAGILRAGRPGFYGAPDVPAVIRAQAADIDADLRLAGEDFGYTRGADAWQWWSSDGLRLADLPLPEPGDDAQFANISLALAAATASAQGPIDASSLRAALYVKPPAGRFQQLARHDRHWLLDVAHNPQAARALAARLAPLGSPADNTIVLGIHANKDLDRVLEPLAPLARRWIACRAGEAAGLDPRELAARLTTAADGEIMWRETPADALQLAVARTQVGDRIVVCGSFEVVGPALEWLEAEPDA